MIDLLRSTTQSQTNPQQLPRTLLILLNLVKELSTGRLQRNRKNLQSATPEVLHVLGQIYVERVRRWRSFLESGGDDEGGAIDDVEQSLLALKVLRRLLIAGYEFPNRNKDVQDFWSSAGAQFTDFVNIAMQHPRVLASEVQKLVGKHLLQLGKLHLDMARTHPAAFTLLPDSMALGRGYWSLIFGFGETLRAESVDPSAAVSAAGESVSGGKSLLEQLSLKGFLILRACVRMMFNPVHTFKYQHAEDKAERKQAKEVLRAQLLTDELAVNIMETVVTRYFVLRPLELREWKDDPEEWERTQEAEGDAWEYANRLCSEKLFLDLLINFKDLLAQRLLNVFYSVSCGYTFCLVLEALILGSAAEH